MPSTNNARRRAARQIIKPSARPARAADKPLDRMDRLADMAHFPVAVNTGATANILLTIAITWYLLPRVPVLAPRLPPAIAPLVWVALVLAINLAPVILLRTRDRVSTAGARPVPTLREMDFVRDQHRFSDWVYLAASANMAFWILVSWAVFSTTGSVRALAAMLAVAFLATFSPVLLRLLSGREH